MIPIPKNSFLNNLEVHHISGGNKVWRSKENKRYYTWDGLHGEVEVFDNNGYHLGSVDPITNEKKKDAVKGRKINVH